MVREQKNNYVALSGEVIQEPTYSHSAGGEDYFTSPSAASASPALRTF